MNKRIAQLLKWFSLKFNGLSVRFDPLIPERTESETRFDPWNAVNGDLTLRLEYPLTHDSLIWDIGGYHGQWTAEMYSRYSCKAAVFEPVREYAENLAKKFAPNPLITVFPYGLGGSDRTERISHLDNGSSLFKAGGDSEEIEVREISRVMKLQKADRIDLMKMNIEGSEYELLENLIKTGTIGKVANLQIQFHDFVDGAAARRDAIRTDLARTHEEQYCFPFVWESWTLKK